MSTTPAPSRAFGLSTTFKVGGSIATVLICAAGFYLGLRGESTMLRLAGAAMVAFGIAGFLDVIVSRIVLEQDAIHVVSLVRRRSFQLKEFESATVDGGVVVLKRRDGGSVRLPDTGANSLTVRNVVDAWIRRI
ncbi:MAG TPA: hypothetical protein VEC39_00805 [Vicinamibacterales bacterium]|nr:hypothetical protein [Vicinamibacterales bacterium]